MSIAAATIRASDGGTGAHSDDVVHLCDAIADELGIHGHDRAELLAAAQLHDVGKVAVPQAVLDKPGPLDDGEWALIREHTVMGEQIVTAVPELNGVARLVRHSHERWDGGGYPDGLSGEQIPLASRIVFCADSFHAIRSNRPYRRGRSAREALQEVKRGAGSQFDPQVTDALVKSAGRMQHSVRAGATGLATTLRSRRLVSLLLTLAFGGSALAAGGSHLLRDGGDAGATGAVPGATAPRDAGDRRSAPRREPPSPAAKPARRGARGTAVATGKSRRRVARTAASAAARTKPRRTEASAARASAPAPAVPRRHRVGRPATPGRSGEAPRRPAEPGKPVGGAPGRSEEAPGRPIRPGKPPAGPVKLPAGPLKLPAVRPPGGVRNR